MTVDKSLARTASRPTKLVMLGTGTPFPDPDRSGPATAIIANDTPYLVDFGPGVVRRAAAAYRNGVTAFGAGAANLRIAFLTHLHSDHTMGYPDLIITPWMMGRSTPLTVYGPSGLEAMTRHVLEAWQVDIDNRLNGPEARLRGGVGVRVHAIEPGAIYRDDNVTVTAFRVDHGHMKNAFGFRFDAPDRSIVISGDTRPTPTLLDHCRGCDVLVHEAYSCHTFERVPAKWQNYRRTHHTSSEELAELANRVKPGLLILHHRSNAGGSPTLPDPESVLIEELRRLYAGPIVTAHDLDVF